MTALNKEKFTEGLMSELMGSSKCSNQRHSSFVGFFFFGEIRPLSQVSGESLFEFKIS